MFLKQEQKGRLIASLLPKEQKRPIFIASLLPKEQKLHIRGVYSRSRREEYTLYGRSRREGAPTNSPERDT